MTRIPSELKLDVIWSRSMPAGTLWVCLKSSVDPAPAAADTVKTLASSFSFTVMFSGE